jgi:IclR family acetate operon transcriptional repressor
VYDRFSLVECYFHFGILRSWGGAMASPRKRTYNITALQRGLRLLSHFSDVNSSFSASRLAALSGLPSSTLHRFLMNLQSAGFLTCDDSGNYHLGIACVSLGQAALGQLDVRRVSIPYLQELNRRTRETVHLTVRFGLTAVYVEKLESPEPLRIHSRIGATVPLYCTAVGKILLAYLAEQEQLELLDQIEFKRFTENTIGSAQELQAQLRRVRRNGYACDLEEHESHIRCIAAPVWDHRGAVNASLSITCPSVRMPLTRLKELAPLMQTAGLGISRELGYAGSGQFEQKSLVSVAAGSGSRRDPARKKLAKQARA